MDNNKDEYFLTVTKDQIITIFDCVENELLRVNLSRCERFKVLSCYLHVRDFIDSIIK